MTLRREGPDGEQRIVHVPLRMIRVWFSTLKAAHLFEYEVWIGPVQITRVDKTRFENGPTNRPGSG